MENLKKTGRN